MAGSLRTSAQARHRGNAAASKNSRWVIGFARFVSYPTSPSPYPGLVPLGKRELAPSPLGTWLSTSSSTVCLQLFDEVNRSDVILSVELNGKVLEEHYISNLNFSWPHMTCVSGFPPRGSRAILVTYMDSAEEIQKFALRFSTCDAAVTFVVALKEKLKSLEEARIKRSEIRSDISYQSDYNPTNEIVSRATEEEANMVRHGYVRETLPRLEYYQTGETLYHPQSTTEKEPNMVKHRGSYVHETPPRLEYHQTGETLYYQQSIAEKEPNMVKHLGSYAPEQVQRLEYHQTGETLSHPQSAAEKQANMVKHLGSYVPEMLPRLEYHQTGQTLYPRQSVIEEERNVAKHLGSYVPEMLPRLEYQTRQTLYQPQSATAQIPNQTPLTLPPSFTTFLSGCFPNSTPDAGKSTLKQDPDLKSQILKYMEDSSFQDMLQKVERIMDEIGSNLIL